MSKPQDSRLEAPQVLIPPADRIARSNSHPGLPVVAAIHVHPQHVLPRLVVVNHLGPLHDAIRPQIPRTLARQQRTRERPLHQVLRGVAVDVGEGVTAAFVLANHVVGAVLDDEARAVGLEVLAVGLEEHHHHNQYPAVKHMHTM